MTISVKQEYSSQWQSSGGSQAFGPGPLKNIFASLLREAKGQIGSPEDRQGRTGSLSGEEIASLVLKMQRQANDHLLRVFTAEGRDEARGSSFQGIPSLLPPPSAAAPPLGIVPVSPLSPEQASKNRLPLQKNDGLHPSGDLEQIIGQAAETYGVERSLIKCVIKAESNFEIRSTSPRGAMGLMQLMPDTARELGVRDAYDPRENIMGGTKYLKGLLNRYGGDTRLALAAYNWGMGNVEKYPDKLPQETRNYIARVTRYLGEA